MIRVHVRWMIRRDLPRCGDISFACFRPPLTVQQIEDLVAQRDCIGMVAEVGVEGRVAGFMVYRLLPESLELLAIGVAPEYRRQGVGAAMLSHIVGKLRGTANRRRKLVWLLVGERTLGAQLWLRACGFRATRVVPDEADPDEALIEFECRV